MSAGPRGAYAVLFPGQGSQGAGMGVAMAGAFPEAARVMALADRIVPGLSRLCREGPEEELRRTCNAQPALVAVSLAVWEAFRHLVDARPPSAGAGHSVGEYAALAAAGAISYESAIRLVRRRGELMESALPREQGGMGAVVGMEDVDVERICQEAAREPEARTAGEQGPGVVAANFNAPGQVVVSGLHGALDRVRVRVEQAGARYVPLAVSGPFHSPYMAPAAKAFGTELAAHSFVAPTWPVIANVTAEAFPDSPGVARAWLERQLVSPVRWTSTLRSMWDMGITHFVEMGAGRVLSGLVRRTLPQAVALSISDPPTLQAALARLKGDQVV